MRITNSILYRNGIFDMQSQRSRLAKVQEAASTGRQINRPSDDPVGIREATMLRDAVRTIEQYERNIGRLGLRLTTTEGALESTNDALVRARELAVQGANATSSPEIRSLLADEVDGLRQDLIRFGNSRASGAYVFSGRASTTAPFVDGVPVSFVGDTAEVAVDVDDASQVKASLNGERVFLGDADGDGLPDPGRVDLFQTLADLRDALRADNQTAISAALPALDDGIRQISQERTLVGSAQNQAERMLDAHGGRRISVLGQLSTIEDADSLEVYSSLVQQETNFRASLEANARLIQPSLLDFI